MDKNVEGNASSGNGPQVYNGAEAAWQKEYVAALTRNGAVLPPVANTVKEPPVAAAVIEHPAVAFLMAFDPNGWHHLDYFFPDGAAPIGKTFKPGDRAGLDAFIKEYDGRANLYFTPNEPAPRAPDKALTKEDIASVRAVYADRDLKPHEARDQGKVRLADLANEFDAKLPATYTLDSGGGIQLFWLLKEKIPASANQEWAENQGRGLADWIGGDDVGNINRFMRLPFTQNMPDAKKRSWGRVQAEARVLSHHDVTYTPAELSQAVPPVLKAAADLSGAVAEAAADMDFGEAVQCESLDALPGDLSQRLATARAKNPRLDVLLRDGAAAVKPGKDASASGLRASLVAQLSRAGFGVQDYACIIHAWSPGWPSKGGFDALDERTLSRDWGRCSVPEDNPEKNFDEIAGAKARAADEAQSAPGLFPAAEGDVFELLSLGQIINQPPPRYLIDRHIPEASLGFLYGDPSSGKSFITLDWALTIAFGKLTWHGDVITAEPDAFVLYLAGEGQSGFRARIRAWAKYHGIPEGDINDGRFRMLPVTVEMMKSVEVGKLIRTLHREPGRVCLVIVDTVSRAMPGAEENLQKDMTLFVAACDRIKREFNCTVLGVHHTNKEGEMRGSTVLMGAGDFVLKLARDTKPANTTLRTLQCMKMKDGPDGWREQYQFDVVAIEDGSSLVPARRVADSIPAIEMPSGLAAQVLAAMDAAWKNGEPWALTRRAKNDRYAGLQMARKFGLDTEAAEAMLKAWRDAGMIEVAVYDTHRRTEGYRVLTYTPPAAVSNTDPESIFG